MPSNPPQELVFEPEVPATVTVAENYAYNESTDSFVTTGYIISTPQGNLSIAKSDADRVANFILNRTGGTPLAY